MGRACPRTVSAASLARGSRPAIRSAAAAPLDKPLALTIQVPTLIGEVTLNIRSMFKNRSGRPRSAISSGGLTPTAAAFT